MFCENCGTRVEDGQPFCPNCGKRMGGPAPSNAAPVNTGYGAPAPSRPVRPVSNSGGLLGKFNAMPLLEKVFFPIVLGLWFVCLILTPMHTMKGISHMQWLPLFGMLSIMMATLAITFMLLDYFDKVSFKWLWLLNLIAASLVLVFFVAGWIDIEIKPSVAGWFFLIFQVGQIVCSVFLMLEKMKK